MKVEAFAVILPNGRLNSVAEKVLRPASLEYSHWNFRLKKAEWIAPMTCLERQPNRLQARD